MQTRAEHSLQPARNQATAVALGNTESVAKLPESAYQKSGTYQNLRLRLDQRLRARAEKQSQPSKSSEKSEKKQKRFRDRGYELRALLREPMKHSKMAVCGFAKGNGLIAIEASDKGGSRLAGGHKCRRSLCAVCGYEKDSKRAAEIRLLFRHAKNNHWFGWFYTLTFSHQSREQVESIGNDLRDCFRETMQNLRHTAIKLGIKIEYEDSLDFNWGANSVHFHKHGALLFATEPTEEQKKVLKREFKRFWTNAAEKRQRKVSKQVGVVLRQLEFNEAGIEDYIAKTGTKSEAAEIAHRTTKDSNGGFGLRDIHEQVAAGSRVWTARFKELDAYFYGTRVHNRTKNLTKLVKQLQAAEKEEKESFVPVFTMTNDVFKKVERTEILRKLLRVAAGVFTSNRMNPAILQIGKFLKQETLSSQDLAQLSAILIACESHKLPPPIDFRTQT